jgi:archaellin
MILGGYRLQLELLAYVLIGIVATFAVWQIQQNSSETINQSNLDACERLNLVREAVYLDLNNREASREKVELLAILQSTDGINPVDGTVDCETVVLEP